METEEIYLICEDSLEGILSGVYDAYRQKRKVEQVHLLLGEDDNYRLFASYDTIETDIHKTQKVVNTLLNRFGEETYLSLCRVMASYEADKAEAVLRTIAAGLQMKHNQDVFGNLADPGIHRAFELSRNAGNEIHFHIEFLRFEELENGILYSEIGPKNNVLTFIMPHFTDRLPLENFVIYDTYRQLYAVHEAKKDWYLVYGNDEMDRIEHKHSQGELYYSELFIHFFHTIAIKERTNYHLQRNMLPIRYRNFMTEFKQKTVKF